MDQTLPVADLLMTAIRTAAHSEAQMGGTKAYNKGGMPTRKVKPRVAMMNYKGNK
jgi:hypothetical protein